jgi:hypothetical protein
MDYGWLIFLFFIIKIATCIIDIRGLVIPASKKTIEVVALVICSAILLGMTYIYAKTWDHYILGVLGVLILILPWVSRGITSKGFNSIRGGSSGKWIKLKEVQVVMKKDVKVSFIISSLNKDIHHYKKDDYDKIISLLREHLPSEKITIR